MKKVLFISYDGMTDPLGQSQVLPYLAGLAKLGHQIHLISFEKKEPYAVLREDILHFCNANSIQWYPEWYTKKPPLLSTLKDIQTGWTTASKLHQQYHFDIVHCRSYIAAMIGQKLKNKFGIPFIFDMRGFWADERIDGGIWSLSNPVFKTVYTFFKKKEIQFLKESSHIVSLTHKAKEEMIAWNIGVDLNAKISVIPCCVNLDLFRRNTESKGNDKSFVLGYVGSIGTWYMLDEMFDFFKSLLLRYPNAEFHFATKDHADSILDVAKKKGIDCDKVNIQSLKHSEVPGFIQTLDASVLFIRPTFSKMASCPTKLGELMAMQIPVIANAGVGDTEAIILEYKAGAVVADFNQNTYDHAISDLVNFDPVLCTKGAEDVFSLEKGIQAYNSIYTSI